MQAVRNVVVFVLLFSIFGCTEMGVSSSAVSTENKKDFIKDIVCTPCSEQGIGDGEEECCASSVVSPIRAFTTPSAMAVPTALLDASGSQIVVGTYTGRIVFPMPIAYPTNGTITRITKWGLKAFTGSGIGIIKAQLFKRNAVSGIETPIGTGRSFTNAAFGPATFAEILSVDTQLADYDQFNVVFTGGGTSGDVLYHLQYELQDQ
jgi:hypothetical protein